MSSSLKNFIYIGLFQGTNFLVLVVFVSYLTKNVGLINYGYLTIMNSICTFFFIIVDYGFSVTSVRKLSVNKSNLIEIKKIIGSTVSAKLVLMFISFPLFFLVSLFFLDSSIGIDFVLLSFISVIGQAVFPAWLTLGLGENKLAFFVNLAGKILLSILVLVFITEVSDWKFFIFFIGLSNLVSGLILFYWVVKHKLSINFRNLLSYKEGLKELSYSKELFLSNFSIGLYLNSTVLILSGFVSPYLMGIYGIAEKVMLVFRTVIGVFVQAVYANVCNRAKMTGISDLISYVTRLTLPFFLVVLVMCIFSAFFSVTIASFFIQSDSVLLAELIRKFSFLPLFVSLNIIPNLVLFAISKERIKSIILIFFAVISIISSYFMVPTFGIDGMVSILYATEILIALASIYFMNRQKYSSNVLETNIIS